MASESDAHSKDGGRETDKQNGDAVTATPKASDSHEERLADLRAGAEHTGHFAHGDISGKYEDRDEEGVDARALEVGKNAREEHDGRAPTAPAMIVVMGVSGCGKSTLGAALAGALGLPFTDADELHPRENVDKMSRGVPLTDADRKPWLERVRAEAVRRSEAQEEGKDTDKDGDGKQLEEEGTRRRGIVVGCSALKKSYRDILRGHTQPEAREEGGLHPAALPTFFVHIRGARDALFSRMEKRKGHFMKAGMLVSQLDTLEPPEETGEPGVAVVDLEASTEDQIRQAIEGLKAAGFEI